MAIQKSPSKRLFALAVTVVIIGLIAANLLVYFMAILSTEQPTNYASQKIHAIGDSLKTKFIKMNDLSPNSALPFIYPYTGDAKKDSEPKHRWILIRLPSKYGGDKDYISSFRAYSMVDLYSGCLINYREAHERLGDPCHGSTYESVNGATITASGSFKDFSYKKNALPKLDLGLETEGYIYVKQPTFEANKNGVIGVGRRVTSYDFWMTPVPDQWAVKVSGSTSFISTISIGSVDVFSGTVSLTASTPSDLKAELSPSSLTLSAGGSSNSTLQITASPAASGLYTVKVIGANGSQTQSAIVRVVVPSVPSVPKNLRATPSNGRITLSWFLPDWDGSSPFTNYNTWDYNNRLLYNIYRGTSYGDETLIAQVKGSILSYDDTSVNIRQTYYYYVKAANSLGESPPSNEASATPAGKQNG